MENMGYDFEKYDNLKNVHKPSKNKLTFLKLLILAGILFGVYKFVLYDKLHPNEIKGDIVSAIYLKESKNIFVYSDDSFYYTSETNTSVSTECAFCKTFGYFYNPYEKKVIKKLVFKFDDLPPNIEIFNFNKKIYILGKDFRKNKSFIRIIDENTYETLNDESAIVNKFSQLAAGISEITVDSKHKHQNAKLITKDGLTFYYIFQYDKLVKNLNEFSKEDNTISDDSPGSDLLTYFAMSKDEFRKTIYTVSGNKDNSWTKWAQNFGVDENSKYEGVINKKLNDKIYLNGFIAFQSDKYAVILHQKEISKSSERIITGIDTNGTEIFTLNQNDLFSKIKLKEDDPFREIFFIKNDISADISNDEVFTFSLKKAGLLIYNFKTKQMIFKIEN